MNFLSLFKISRFHSFQQTLILKSCGRFGVDRFVQINLAAGAVCSRAHHSSRLLNKTISQPGPVIRKGRSAPPITSPHQLSTFDRRFSTVDREYTFSSPVVKYSRHGWQRVAFGTNETITTLSTGYF